MICGLRFVMCVSVFQDSLLLNFRVCAFSSFSSQVFFTLLLKHGKFRRFTDLTDIGA